MSKLFPLIFLLVHLQGLCQMNWTIVSDAYSYKSYDVSNGLPQSAVSAVKQSSDGFIWIGTYAGIARFDGSSFKTYDASNIKGLQSDMFYAMIDDKKDGVWGMSEHDLVHIQKNSAHCYTLPFNAFKTNLSGLTIAGGDVFVQADSMLYRLRNGRFLVHCRVPQGLMLRDGDGERLYFEKNKQALYTLEKGLFKPVFYFPKTFDRLFFDDKHIYFSKGTVLYEVLPSVTYKEHVLPHSVSDGYRYVIPLRNKRYAFMNDSKMAIYDELYGTTESVKLVSDKASTLYMNLEDMDGNLWLYTNQLSLIHLCKKGISSYPAFNINNTSYNAGQYFIYFNPFDCSIWMQASLKTNELKRSLMRLEKQGVSQVLPDYNMEIRTMLIDHKGNEWYCASNDGVYVKYKNTRQFKVIRVPVGSFFSLFESSDKRIWLGTDAGVFVLQGDSSFVPYLKCGNVYQMASDYNGVMWFATSQGIYKSWKDHITHYGKEDGLPTNEVRCIYPDDDGTVWIGTSNFGLCRLKNNQLFQFPVDEDLINHNIWSIVEDQSEHLWMSSNNGIYRLKEKELNDYADGNGPLFFSEHYSSQNGIYNAEFNSRTQNKGFMDHNGYIWFASVRGPVRIDPRHFTPKRQFPILIENVLANGRPALKSEDTVFITSNKNHLKVRYSVPFFGNINTPVFCYRLVGYDHSWRKTKERYIEYRDIPGGDYLLLLCLNNNPATAIRLHVHVEETFYETTTFIVVMSILLTSIPFMLVLWIVKRMNRQRLQRKNEKLFLSSMKVMSLTSQLNPHFIFNCLNTLQSMYMTRDLIQANEFMGNFSKLLRLTIEHLRKQQVTLKEELTLVNLYITLELIQFENPFDYHLIIDDSINTDEIELPAMLMQIFVENAIKHGLHGLKDRQGELTIRVSKTGKNIKITIHDNGIGIDTDRKPTTKRSAPSRGTELVLEQVALYNETSENKIYIHVQNLKNENPEEFGTIISIIYTAF